MKQLLKIAAPLFITLVFLFTTKNIFAKVGVGVGTGKIYVDEQLKPGTIYKLPVLTVINTGDEKADYVVTASYRSEQEELAPKEHWFSFSPDNFELEPGKAQNVEVTLNTPIKAEPGDYFAFLEARPTKTREEGTTSIGIAAAAKLYFTIVPGNPLEGMYYRLRSLWINNQPLASILAGIIVAIVLTRVASRYINLNISIGKKKPEKETKKEDEE